MLMSYREKTKIRKKNKIFLLPINSKYEIIIKRNVNSSDDFEYFICFHLEDLQLCVDGENLNKMTKQTKEKKKRRQKRFKSASL